MMLFPDPGTTTGGLAGAAGLDELPTDAILAFRITLRISVNVVAGRVAVAGRLPTPPRGT